MPPQEALLTQSLLKREFASKTGVTNSMRRYESCLKIEPASD